MRIGSARAPAAGRGDQAAAAVCAPLRRLRPILLRQVVGTDSRGGDFDREFHPRRPDIRDRWQARWHLPADADVVELVHAEQERILVDESGLGEIRPEVRIRFSRPVGYIQLLETVQLHGYHLMRAGGRVLPKAEIARSWYETVYEPTIDVIRAEGLEDACRGATDPDRFLWVWDRRRELMPEHGCRPLDETARHANAELVRERRRALGLLPRRSRGASPRPRRSGGRAAPRR